MFVDATLTRGAKLSHVLSLFPVLASVPATFTHRNIAVDRAITLLRGLARGLFSVARLCFTLNLLWTCVEVATASITVSFVSLLIH